LKKIKIILASVFIAFFLPIQINLNAAEKNTKQISGYINHKDELNQYFELSDIHPGEWIYETLSNIWIKRQCNVSLPQGVLSRYEVASFLDKCIGEAGELSLAEFKLVEEFSIELSTIKANKSLLEQFSFEAKS
tara:strand:- start:419 stop:820 length:402 start_codon:yes stop_codon:yes gene_type:complete